MQFYLKIKILWSFKVKNMSLANVTFLGSPRVAGEGDQGLYFKWLYLEKMDGTPHFFLHFFTILPNTNKISKFKENP